MNKFIFVFIFPLFLLFNGCSSKKESIIVSKEDKYLLLSKDISKNSYDELTSLDSINEKYILNKSLKNWLYNDFGMLYSIVVKDGKYGIINDKNEFLIKPEFDYISKLYNGFFIIKKDGKYGYVNDNFEIIQKPLYLDAKEFSKDVAFVKFSNEKWGCISAKMKVLLEGKFDKIFPYMNSYSRVLKDDKWGFINQKCEIIVVPKYDYINDFYSDSSKVILNKKVGYINKNGDEIVAPILDYGQNFKE